MERKTSLLINLKDDILDFFYHPPLLFKMSYAAQKQQYDDVEASLTYSLTHLIRPGTGFPYYNNYQILQLWNDWTEARAEFWRLTGRGIANRPSCPEPPAEDAEHKPCRELWGHVLQEIVVSGTSSLYIDSMKKTVTDILASEDCKTHPATCSCKVPINPWTWVKAVEAVEPLCITHNRACNCAGFGSCKKNS